MKYMLDTNICIYVIKKKPESVLKKFRENFGNGLCISVITLSELMYGAEKSQAFEKNKAMIDELLETLPVLSLKSSVSYEYGKIRAYLEKRGTPIGMMDMLIAAHAKTEDLILVTNNMKEFERVPGLKLENWVE